MLLTVYFLVFPSEETPNTVLRAPINPLPSACDAVPGAYV